MSAPKRFCPECGKENSPGARFCKECGATIGSPDKVGWWSRQSSRVKIALVVAPLILAALIIGLAVGLTGGPSGPDLGKAEVVEPDPSSYVDSDIYGIAASNNVLVVMDEGLGRAEADQVAAQLGGVVVGEIEFVDLYQIQTSGSSAQDLEQAIGEAEAVSGVKYATSNNLMFTSAAVAGKTCSPLWDPAYQSGENYIPYEMIGMMEAVEILKVSHAELDEVHVGVSDTPVYTDSGQGLATELHFPDAGGGYPQGEVRVRGLVAGDTTDAPDPKAEGGLSHGTEVTHIIAADWGDGVTGVASALGDRLSVTCSSSHGGPAFDYPDDLTTEKLRATDLDTYASGSFGSAIAELIRQVRDGDATVINMSWVVGDAPGDDKHNHAAIFADFFHKMATAYPRVLFVAAAGNESGALDGQNYAPGGLAGLSNLITVGALDREGDRADIFDWSTEEERQAGYRALSAAGDIPAGQTYEEWVATYPMGSNYAEGGGEVTISACGTGVLVGRDADGNPIASNGTSFSAPQVAAAAALMKSIDPSLEAWEIKDILVETGDTEVTVSGTRVAVPENVGGRVLRVDKAVLKVINRLRGPDNELIYGDLIDLATISLTAEEHEFGYLVEATTPRVETPSGVDLRITVEGEAEIFGEETHRIYSNLETGSWTVAPGPDPVKVKVERLDNGACAFLELPGTGEPDSTTTTESTATTVNTAGTSWSLTGGPVVNPEGLPLEYNGGGADPYWFPEPRFEGKWLKYRPAATSFGVDMRDVDHEFEYYNVTIDCVFDAPPAVLVAGETYELTVNCTYGGVVVEGNPGIIFQYFTEDAILDPEYEGLSFSPWSIYPEAQVPTKTWKLTIPEGSPGDTLVITAGLWNAAQCSVVWTYTVE